MEMTASRESDPESRGGSFATAIVLNPVLHTLGVMGIVSLVAWTGFQAGNADPFVLQAPVEESWWQLPLSVYSHSNRAHLVGNATVIVIAGGIVSLSASWVRFHIFFLATGMLAGLSQLWLTAALGDPVGGLGASGAAFGLVGYILTSNVASTSILKRVPWYAIAVVVVGLALLLTIQSAGARIANAAHFAGAVIGLAAGYFHVLRAK